MTIPEHLKYTNDHEWILVEGTTGTIGVTEYAQGELGDVVYVDIDGSVSELRKGEKFGSIEAVKTVSDLFAPCSGRLLGVNTELNSAPEAVNSDPYGKGWMIKIEIADASELNELLDAAAYKEIIGA
jgi:glycine cleavage system H protein